MAVNEQTARFCGVAAEGQDRFDIGFLGQKNVWTWLDRIVKAQRRAKMRIISEESFRIRPFGVENR